MKGKLYDFYILHQKKYKENSILVSLFTLEFGKLSAIIRVNKKQQNLYQPITKLRGEISFSKKGDGLNKVFNIEFVESNYKSSYIILLSIQYVNELMYLLLTYSHEEEALFRKYDFLIKNINENNYKYLLRMFELELLNSLGQTICTDKDIAGEKIKLDEFYEVIPLTGFKLMVEKDTSKISGKSIKKIYDSMVLWDEEDLAYIGKITKISINACLDRRELKSRKLLLDYLRLKDN
ncbi:DNA repair protein RecO [Pseudofrancisella aestuarii]|uniref:DNA repair protein RecO n=1 Tax=Pseudofrancisella aestuarii TaxID=2670347 RepID=A0ABV9T9Y1_9GAMM|nr:DNA repair protein RecO [Pseudofrancisella aestuarii]